MTRAALFLLAACSSHHGSPLPPIASHVEVVEVVGVTGRPAPKATAYIQSRLPELADCLAQVDELSFMYATLASHPETVDVLGADVYPVTGLTGMHRDVCFTQHARTWKLPEVGGFSVKLAYVKPVPRNPYRSEADAAAWQAVCDAPPPLTPADLPAHVHAALAKHPSDEVAGYFDRGEPAGRTLRIRGALDGAGITSCPLYTWLQNQPPAKQDPAAAPVADQACPDRAARLRQKLGELASGMPGFMPLEKIDAPRSAAGKPIDARGVVIAITRDGKLITRGGVLANMKHARQVLDEQSKEQLEDLAFGGGEVHGAKFPLYVWADAGAPAKAVAELVDTAHEVSDHYEPRLLVATDGAPVADDARASKIPAAEPEATTYVVDQLKASIGDCAPIIMPLATETGPGKTQKLLEGVTAGLEKCDCKIPDVDTFEWGMQVWFGSRAPVLVWIEMPKLGKTGTVGAAVK